MNKIKNQTDYKESAGIVCTSRIRNGIPIGIIIITMILLMIGGVWVVQANSSQTSSFNRYGYNAETRAERVRYYKSIQIQPGDSLWSIAQVYRTEEFPSIYAYIEAIYELNELQSETIWAGSYLMVICYKDV